MPIIITGQRFNPTANLILNNTPESIKSSDGIHATKRVKKGILFQTTGGQRSKKRNFLALLDSSGGNQELRFIGGEPSEPPPLDRAYTIFCIPYFVYCLLKKLTWAKKDLIKKYHFFYKKPQKALAKKFYGAIL